MASLSPQEKEDFAKELLKKKPESEVTRRGHGSGDGRKNLRQAMEMEALSKSASNDLKGEILKPVARCSLQEAVSLATDLETKEE